MSSRLAAGCLLSALSLGAPLYQATAAEIDPGRYALDAVLRKNPPGPDAPGDNFGFDVAIDDGWLAIGDIGRRTVTLYSLSEGSWVKQQVIPSPNASNDLFGVTVALSGTRLAVGAAAANGTVYTYSREGSNWQFHSQIVHVPVAGAFNAFGLALKMSGDDLLVGAPGVPAGAGTGPGNGAVYPYHWNGASWAADPPLFTPIDEPASGGVFFGYSVALESGVAAVGQLRGIRPHVYTRGQSGWSADAYSNVGAPTLSGSENFGSEIALSGDVVVVGGPEQQLGSSPGAAYLYQRSNGVWSYQSTVSGDVPDELQQFGSALLLTPDALWVGAPAAARAGVANVGRVIRFERTGTTLGAGADAPSGTEPLGAFGSSLAASGGFLALGAPNYTWVSTPNPRAGAVLLFRDLDELLFGSGFE